MAPQLVWACFGPGRRILAATSKLILILICCAWRQKFVFRFLLPEILFYWKSHKIWILNNQEICLIRHWLNDRSKLPNWRRFVKFLSVSLSISHRCPLYSLFRNFHVVFFLALSLSLINFIVANFFVYFWESIYIWRYIGFFRDSISFYFDPDAFNIIDYFICILRLAISDELIRIVSGHITKSRRFGSLSRTYCVTVLYDISFCCRAL